MTAYNVVRFRTKPGKEQAFIDAHKKASLDATGLRKAALIKTGDRTFCVVGEWNDLDGLAAAQDLKGPNCGLGAHPSTS
ncbi:antibiotic biosynthesis monooxygenase [Mesorhizobium opportunistum]|uniref:Antibiotic biosynthesis monooxygenase n=1 Tax=Mesorhizobium opportunistum TaxID=593909 RepID=A0ABV1YB99_9HYPH